MKNKTLTFKPVKLQALRKQLEQRIHRRKVVKELLLPREKHGFISKVKDVFN